MPRAQGATWRQGHSLAFAIIVTVLASAAVTTTVACGSVGSKPGSAPDSAVPEPEVLSLAPSTGDVHELVLSWKPMTGIERFVLCETVPPNGTTCEEHRGVSQVTVAVPGPTDDPNANGTWLKYLWLQSCTERECSRPSTPAGAIAHRVAYGTNRWNFVVAVRRLEGSQVEVALANASQGTSRTSTLIARLPNGSEVARGEDVAPGEWYGPVQSALLSNEIVGEQVYGDAGVTVEFPVMPSSTAPEPTSEATPKPP